MQTGDIDYTRFVLPDRVDSRIFTDEEIFEEELVKIFEADWAYIAHESEVPEVGDYVTRIIGRQPVLVVRAKDGVRLFLNRCVHRGTSLCNDERGNARFFRCPYHGWTYDSQGKLVGVPYPAGYGPDFDKTDFGLTPLPASSVYRGFIFGSLCPTSTSLDDWLGPRVKTMIDAFLDVSPVGRVVVRSGSLKHVFRGNWKYAGMDAYHVKFTHKSLGAIAQRKGDGARAGGDTDIDDWGGWEDYEDGSPSVMWDFGNGHTLLDTDPNHGQAHRDELLANVRKLAGGAEYLAALEAQWGPDTSKMIARARDVHLGVWPNLRIIGPAILVVRPLAADRTEQTIFATQLEGAPETINENRLRQQEWANGAAGFVLPDDAEIFERVRLGLQARVNPWVYLARGLNRETVNEDGSIVGHITDETTQRGMMKMWLRQMIRPAIDGTR